MLVAAPTKDYSQTVMRAVSAWREEDESWLIHEAAPLADRALAEMAAEGYEASRVTLNYRLDMRYKGQSHELTVPWVSGETAVTERFHAAHQLRYGYRLPEDEMMEVVTLRVTAVAPVVPPKILQEVPGSPDASAAVLGEKQVWFKQQPHRATLYEREKLRPGHQINGPAIVFQYDTTLVVPPGWEAVVDRFRNLILTFIN